ASAPLLSRYPAAVTRDTQSCACESNALGCRPSSRSSRARRRGPPFAHDTACCRLSNSCCGQKPLLCSGPVRSKTISSLHLTDRALNRYYTASPMSDAGLHTYGPLVIHLLVAAFLAGTIATLSKVVGWRRPSKAKLQAYECGMVPTGDAREPFSVKFYLVAMLFILFDVEAIFLYPWAYVFRQLGLYGFIEMMIYIAILLVGYFYLWKKGALDWHK